MHTDVLLSASIACLSRVLKMQGIFEEIAPFLIVLTIAIFGSTFFLTINAQDMQEFSWENGWTWPFMSTFRMCFLGEVKLRELPAFSQVGAMIVNVG